MKKLLLSLVMVAGLGFAASAQTEGAVNKISVGPDFLLPVGNNTNGISLGYGGSVMGEFNVAKSLNLTVSGGYISMAPEKALKDLGATNSGVIPLKAGAKYYFGGNFYGAGELGAAIFTEKNSGTAFSYAPTIGASFSVADKSSIDLGIRYEGWSKSSATSGGITLSFIGIRAAYAFGL